MSEYQQQGSHGAHCPGGGGDGQGLGQLFGLDKQAHGHNFLSHLLGLDHEAHISTAHGAGLPGHAHGHTTGQALQSPSHSASWSSALQSVKLSDALQGITITPQMLFLLLFASFIAWLFVVYWIRHHEPLANGVLGIAAARSATAEADRQIIAKTKYAFPSRTSAETGDIFVPTPIGMPASRPADNPQPSAAYARVPLPAPPVPPIPSPEPQPTPLSVSGILPAQVPYASAFGQPAFVHAYVIPEAEAAGTRAKMIVNR